MDERVKRLNVSVAYAGPEWSGEIALSIPVGANTRDAIIASGIQQHIENFLMENASCGIWGKTRPADYVLRDGDRVEIYRPLQADPKDARRARVNTKKR